MGRGEGRGGPGGGVLSASTLFFHSLFFHSSKVVTKERAKMALNVIKPMQILFWCWCQVREHNSIKVPHIPILRSRCYKEFLIALNQKGKAGVQSCVYTFQSAHIFFFFSLAFAQCVVWDWKTTIIIKRQFKKTYLHRVPVGQWDGKP